MLLANKIRQPKIAKVDFCLSASIIQMKISIRTVNYSINSKHQNFLNIKAKEQSIFKKNRSDLSGMI